MTILVTPLWKQKKEPWDYIPGKVEEVLGPLADAERSEAVPDEVDDDDDQPEQGQKDLVQQVAFADGVVWRGRRRESHYC